MCLSGGVDSSVSLALLKKAGYDVMAAFMINYDEQRNGESCWRPDYQDALRVAAKLGVKLLRLDFTADYSRDVLQYMYKEYEAGQTPNPDVLCNKFVKFGAWIKKADELGFDFIATGHYAKIKKSGRKFLLQEAKDKNKDQTYFLHQLNQKQLSKTMFPIGGYTKQQVRELAIKFDLPTAQKEESMGICFIGEVSMRDFLKNKIKVQSGNIVDEQGNILGKHDGLAYYTIGQRNLGINAKNGKPLFVVNKNVEKNEVIVGGDESPLLFKNEIKVGDINWTAGVAPKFPLKCQARLRHRQELQDCVVTKDGVKFSKPQRAVTPGQFAVFYKGGLCLGGGTIE